MLSQMVSTGAIGRRAMDRACRRLPGSPGAQVPCGPSSRRAGDSGLCGPGPGTTGCCRMDRLSALSTAFLQAEDVDPAPPSRSGRWRSSKAPRPRRGVRRAHRGPAPGIPRYRQRLQTVPFDLAAPAWVDDAGLRHALAHPNTALPSPGGRREIGRFLSRVMSRRMDRTARCGSTGSAKGSDGRWACCPSCTTAWSTASRARTSTSWCWTPRPSRDGPRPSRGSRPRRRLVARARGRRGQEPRLGRGPCAARAWGRTSW